MATASVLVGCNATLIDDAGEVGWLMIGFSGGDESTKVGTADYSSYIVTMAGPSQYTLESTYGELPTVLELEPGDYTITVSTPGEAMAAFTPIYSSSKNFTIEAGKTSSVTLLLANVAVTLLPSDTFNRDTVESCEAVVSYEGHDLKWTLDDILNGRTGYFIGSASTVRISLEGLAKKDGKKLEYHQTIHDIEVPVNLKVTLGEWIPEI